MNEDIEADPLEYAEKNEVDDTYWVRQEVKTIEDLFWNKFCTDIAAVTPNLLANNIIYPRAL